MRVQITKKKLGSQGSLEKKLSVGGNKKNNTRQFPKKNAIIIKKMLTKFIKIEIINKNLIIIS